MEKLKTLYNKMTPREKGLFYGACAVIFLMISDLMVLHPILSHIKVLEAEIDAKAQSIQRDMRIASFKDSIIGDYRQYEKYLDTGEKTQEEIIAGLLKKLESVASQNNIKITNVMPGELEDKPIYKIYKTTLEFEGNLKDTLVFMNTLEESDNLFQITRYLLAPKNKSGESMKANMDVSRILITAEDIASLYANGEEPPAGAQPSASAEPSPSAVQSAQPAPSGSAAPGTPEPI